MLQNSFVLTPRIHQILMEHAQKTGERIFIPATPVEESAQTNTARIESIAKSISSVKVAAELLARMSNEMSDAHMMLSVMDDDLSSMLREAQDGAPVREPDVPAALLGAVGVIEGVQQMIHQCVDYDLEALMGAVSTIAAEAVNYREEAPVASDAPDMVESGVANDIYASTPGKMEQASQQPCGCPTCSLGFSSIPIRIIRVS